MSGGSIACVRREYSLCQEGGIACVRKEYSLCQEGV